MNDKQEVIHGHVIAEILPESGEFPNNPNLPVLVYKGSLFLHPEDEPGKILEIFDRNGWRNGWEGGIQDIHHYHRNTHEVLGVFCGTVDLQLGGPEGICVELGRGDAVVIPAGVAHKNINSSSDFLCAGAYPEGRDYDMNYGKEGDQDAIVAEISGVPIPVNDPLFGNAGPLPEHWR